MNICQCRLLHRESEIDMIRIELACLLCYHVYVDCKCHHINVYLYTNIAYIANTHMKILSPLSCMLATITTADFSVVFAAAGGRITFGFV